MKSVSLWALRFVGILFFTSSTHWLGQEWENCSLKVCSFDAIKCSCILHSTNTLNIKPPSFLNSTTGAADGLFTGHWFPLSSRDRWTHSTTATAMQKGVIWDGTITQAKYRNVYCARTFLLIYGFLGPC